nr:MAG TPA: hypothetical protein [Caudoviricetes sp.]
MTSRRTPASWSSPSTASVRRRLRSTPRRCL